MAQDAEHNIETFPTIKGYPSLANFIASDVDHSTAIYRRFDRLAARNLLYLQSDLMHLEATQDALDSEDLRSSIEAKRELDDWQTLQEEAKLPASLGERRRLELALNIKAKLQQYSKSNHTDEHVLPRTDHYQEKLWRWNTLCSL